jgi:hypothetical protein
LLRARRRKAPVEFGYERGDNGESVRPALREATLRNSHAVTRVVILSLSDEDRRRISTNDFAQIVC